MNSNKYCVPILLLCVLLTNVVKQTDSQDVNKDSVMETMSYVSGLVGLIPVVGTFLSSSIGCLILSAKIFTGDEQEPLTKTDFLESQGKIAEAVQNVDTHVQESTRILTHEIQANEMMEDMRNDLDTLREAFDDSMKVILNPKLTGLTKKTRMHAMLDYYSDFRQTLRSFVGKYIKTKHLVSAQGHVKLFFDFILNKESIEIDGGDYCRPESTHTKLFKSYIYILKTLSDAYVMAVSAHTMRYQAELKKNPENAIETQNFGLKLLNQYKTDMIAFMGKAKWAMDKASREIQNCGKFELKRGETYESISFAHILPRFKEFLHYAPPGYNCKRPEEDVRIDDYEVIHYACTDGGIDRLPVTVFINSTASQWPYLFLKIKSYWPWGSDTFLGHTKPETGLRSRLFGSSRDCYSVYCPAFKKNAVAICTQVVRAKPGFVITGVRFRIRDNVICFDIQQGKYINDLSVDPATVTWTETPKSNDKIYLTSRTRKLELGVVELKDNDCLTAIQFKLKNDGIIGLVLGGGRASNWTTSGPLTGSSYSDKSNELVLSGRDNPEQFGSGVKNMISKPPVPSKPYHCTFQATGLKEDFGATTIPFIDLREVYSYPAAPLGGLGMYHHAVAGSGGFISLKLLAPSLSRFVDAKVMEAIDTTTKA